MNIFRIRHKESGEFFQNTDGRALWLSGYNAEAELRGYMFLKNYEEWRSQWEIVEYELREIPSGS